MVIVDKNSTYGKKPAVVITSQGTPEHNRDPIYTMSAHDKAELFIQQMREKKLEESKGKSKIITKKKKKGRKK